MTCRQFPRLQFQFMTIGDFKKVGVQVSLEFGSCTARRQTESPAPYQPMCRRSGKCGCCIWDIVILCNDRGGIWLPHAVIEFPEDPEEPSLVLLDRKTMNVVTVILEIGDIYVQEGHTEPCSYFFDFMSSRVDNNFKASSNYDSEKQEPTQHTKGRTQVSGRHR